MLNKAFEGLNKAFEEIDLKLDRETKNSIDNYIKNSRKSRKKSTFDIYEKYRMLNKVFEEINQRENPKKT